MKSTTVIIVIAIIAAYYYKVYDAINRFGYTTGKVEKVDISNGNLSFTANLLVTNGDVTPVLVTSVNMVSIIAGTEIGTVILEEPTWITGRSSNVPLKLRCTIPYGSLFTIPTLLLNMLKSGNLSVTFQGRASTIGVTSPIITLKFGVVTPKINI